MISQAIVNLARPLSRKLSEFNIYVALSQSAGQATIHLLQDFDETLFQKSFDPDLTIEDEHLECLNQVVHTAWVHSCSEFMVWWHCSVYVRQYSCMLIHHRSSVLIRILVTHIIYKTLTE
jgi:hypothetical protein